MYALKDTCINNVIFRVGFKNIWLNLGGIEGSRAEVGCG
jgi:hypothetical protein